MISTPLESESVSEPPPEAPPPKKKRLVTDAMRAANKANAARSSGPASDRARAAVRINALKHGQTCKTLIFLPDEDPAMFWKEVAVWAQARGAVTADEIALVETAVYSRWTRRRAQNAQAWAVKEAIDNVNNGFKDRKTAEVQELIPQLATAPRVTVNALMTSSCGCAFLIKQFIMLGKWLKIHPSFEATQRPYFIQLLGHRPEDLFVDRDVWEINREYLGAMRGAGGWTAEEAAKDAFVFDRHEDMDEFEFERRLGRMVKNLPSKEDGLARLQKRVKKAIKRLRERLELVRFRETEMTKAAIGKAQSDISPDGDKRARYMAMSDRTMISSLRTVLALKKDRKASGDEDEAPELDDWTPEDEPPPEPGPAPEPACEAEPEAERAETPAPSGPVESDQAHPNGAFEPVVESPVPGADSSIKDAAQNNPVATQVVDEAGNNNAFTAPPAAGSASPVSLSHADHEASLAEYRRMLADVAAKLDECLEIEPSGEVPEAGGQAGGTATSF